MNRYQKYLLSSTWKERRLAKLERAKFKCERCGAKGYLEVHHKTYERLGNERTDDLIVLCKSCHWAADREREGNANMRKALDAPDTRTNPLPPKLVSERYPRNYKCIKCGIMTNSDGVENAKAMRKQKLCRECFWGFTPSHKNH